MGLPVLKLSPVLGLLAGMVFFVKAGILDGVFYFQAAALFLTAGVMAAWPQFGHLIFGVVSRPASSCRGGSTIGNGWRGESKFV